MDKHRFDRIVQTLLSEMGDADARKALVESALYGASVLQRIEWEGAARTFTVRLVRLLHDYGEIAPGKPALIALLEEVHGQVGEDRQRQIDVLIGEMSAPPGAQAITPPPKTFTAGEHYVFISYARPDQAVAEKIESYLKAAGVRVFRDTSEIREGANWDMTIETALRECGRMVLLLSAASMPYRKEVHREWFYFDQNRKPIYPLLVQACDLHSRLYAYNYIDARADLQGALDRLLKELGRNFDLPEASTGADVIGVFPDADVAPRTLPQALADLLAAVRDPAGSVVLSVEQANAVKDHKPADLTEYRLGRIAEWSLPRYALDNRFVNLTLLLDKGESDPQRWQRAEDFRFNDLRDVLAKVPDPSFVLLGAPGSGKSTLLRRLQLDHSIDRLRDSVALTDSGGAITFFIQLNGYRPRADGVLLDPRAWLEARWSERYPNLPPLDSFLKGGKALLLLDALNEMPHRSTAEYHERVGLWRAFAQEAAGLGNRLIFSCRSLDYSASLSSPEMRVPQIEVQPMNADQVRHFLKVYVPAHEALIWRELDGSPQFSLFQTPYFLKLLCEQVEANRTVPKGRAALFTGFVRQVLYREINGALFQPDTLLTGHDHQKLSLGKWRSPFDLPERGVLIPKLSALAFTMQEKGLETEGAQVRIDYDDACDLLAHDRDEDILKAGIALNVLDEDITQYEIAFFHQLLQEFFAARKLAETPNAALVHVEWAADRVRPSLEETLAGLADGDPLPPLPQTGWEETTLTAAPMSRDPNAFIRDLIPHNLPLAARCAAAGETAIDPVLVRDLQSRLIARTQDMSADLRARIAAGEALGMLGDPRFERKTGAYGDFLLPPLVSIEGGTYPIGDDASGFDDEKPAHTVELAPFQIGMFPVTNAEYALFIAAGGYEDERWWDTDEAKAWLRGEGSNEGGKRQWRENRRTLQGWSEEDIRGLVRQNRITSQQADDWITVRNWSDERFEQQLDEWYPSGRTYRQPEFWNDARFNNPAQPVVGVTWFEARAYCAWLTANAFPSPPAPLPQGERGVEHVERWAITPELATTMTEIARRLRRDATSSEDMLWQALRNRQLDGRKFRRQEAVGAFVLDLYCPQERLAVEIDGGIHDLPEQQRADAARQALLESLGIRFVRLPAALVEQNLAAALARIRAAFLPTPQTGSARVLPSPLVGEGSGVRGFRLPTEVEFEAAARGKGGRKFAYGAAFDSARCNTFESHLRRSTPVGIFDNATPEGVFDLSGNVYTWTTTIYDQEAYPYPYNQDDGREDVSRTDVLRVLRGGSWRYNQNNARAAFRNWDLPNVRGSDVGFRVVVGFVPI